MGMFDNISISDPLPFTDEMKELGLDVNNRTWQTKDLDCAMGLYFIQGGELFEQKYKNTEWKQGDPNGESVMDRIGALVQSEPYLEKVNFHGEVNFYDHIDDVAGKWDCWIEFKATLSHGKIDKIELIDFTKTDSAERKQKDKEFWEKIDMENRIWYNRLFFHTKTFRWFKFEVWHKFWINLGQFCYKISRLPL